MGFTKLRSRTVAINTFTIFFLLLALSALGGANRNDTAVKNFRDYLMIKTAHPDPDYDSAVTWIEQQAREIGLKYNIVRFSETKKAEFTIWLTWEGLDTSLPSLFLYSHIDVVAVDPEWKHNPFAAEVDSEGNIYGRGAQDMKSVGVQYLEAIRNLKSRGVTPNRTVHIGFIPDEEIGGHTGIKLFILTPEFINLNVGFVLDEGAPQMPTDAPNEFSVYYAQRLLVWVNFTALGDSGHGSLLLDNTAAVKIVKVINKLMTLRESEKSLLETNKTLQLGDVSSINLNILEGGFEANIIPPKFSAVFDLRITPHATYAEVMKFLNDTCTEAGPNVTYEIIHTSLRADQEHSVTKLDENSWWWSNFQKAFQKMNLTAVPRVFPAGSDGQITRNLGIPTLGFSPIYNTTMLFHSRDEYLNIEVFLKGIEIYETLIETLVYVPSPPVPTTMKPDHSHAHGIGDKGNGTSDGPTKKPSKGKSSAPALWNTSAFTLLCVCLCYTFFIDK